MSSHDTFQTLSYLKKMQEKNPAITHVLGLDHSLYTIKNGILKKGGTIPYNQSSRIEDLAKPTTLYITLYVLDERSGSRAHYWGNYFLSGEYNRDDISIIISAFMSFDNKGFSPEIFGFSSIQDIDPQAPKELTQHFFGAIASLDYGMTDSEMMTKDVFLSKCQSVLKLKNLENHSIQS